jgi:hypothetical protein
LLGTSSAAHSTDGITIEADPGIRYSIRNILEESLPLYLPKHSRLFIHIKIADRSASVVYTERQIAKEQLRLSAHITVYDSEHNQLGDKCLDVFSTYEVGDALPYSDTVSKSQVIESMTTELGNSITMAIVAVMKQKEDKP